MPEPEELAYWMAFGSLGTPRSTLDVLLAEYDSLHEAWHTSDEDLLSALPSGETSEAWIARRAKRDVAAYQDILVDCRRTGIHVVTWKDAEYPPQLRELEDPPLVLYARGELPIPSDKAVAIVGTREPTHEGIERAKNLAYRCAQERIIVVSGLAAGIDSAAHRGCLAAQGFTVAVLGSGLKEVYPKQNESLSEDIARHGLLLSEYPPRFRVRRWSLRARNRLIAALSQALVVVEARQRSGVYIAADRSQALGRKLFAFRPSEPLLPTSVGPERLIARGATPIDGPEEVVSWFQDLALHVQTARLSQPSEGRRASLSPPSGDEEDQAIHAVLREIGRFLELKNVQLEFLTETKLTKWVHEVAESLGLPITRSWYLRGCYVYSPLVRVDTLRRWRELSTNAPSTVSQSVRGAVERVERRWNLLYTRGDAFLERFYREAAPQRYRQIYMRHLGLEDHLARAYGVLRPSASVANQEALDAWTEIETHIGQGMLEGFAGFRSELAGLEEFDSYAPTIEAYTFLLEDVARWSDRSSILREDLPQPARAVGVDLIETYRNSVWRLIATKIAAREAEGPRAPELSRTMERTAADLEDSLKRELPSIAEQWATELHPLEQRYRLEVLREQTG